MDALGEDVRQLLRRGDPDQTLMSILDGLVREVLADVDVLGTYPSPIDVVAPFNARGVVLVDRRIPRRR